MPKEKKSFFERLTGTVKLDEMEEETAEIETNRKHQILEEEEEEKDGELTVDVYQTSEMIIIKTMVAGVRPEDLDIAITRDMVTIKGKREEERGIKESDYFIRELYWGSFSRTVILPQEIEVEESEAIEKHGLLIIKLPKVDKGRQTRLKVKTI
jgi:HSP20 family protein